MKFVWEESDIKPGIRAVDLKDNEVRIGVLAGPLPASHPFFSRVKNLAINYVLIKAKSWEAFFVGSSKEMAEFLTEGGYIPLVACGCSRMVVCGVG